MTRQSKPTILVAICTYNRPEQLARTLSKFQNLDWQPGLLHVLVVDNDINQSARSVAEEAGAVYVVQEMRGVGNARNKALEHVRTATPTINALIFFDDDQDPSSGWLQAFLTGHAQWPNAILVGPVQPRLDFTLPDWAPLGWPWSRPSRQDGSVLSVAGDGNVLVPKPIFDLPTFRYAREFALGMGQDTELFMRMSRAGIELRYVAEATALEDVPIERREPTWVINRAGMAADAWARAVCLHSSFGRFRVLLSLLKILGDLIRGSVTPSPSPKRVVQIACRKAELKMLRRNLLW